MPELAVLCAECERQKELLERPGDVKVSSCEPDPARPGVCLLTFEYTFETGAKAAKKPGKKPTKKTAAKKR